ncbi:MAG: universal stress protein [Gammaproteobacteria bacterium]
MAYDGSAPSQRALAYAIDLAQRRGVDRLHVLTVHPEPIVYGQVQVYLDHARAAQVAAAHDRAILADAASACATAGVHCTLEACEGDPAPTIAERAQALGCTQVVMGTRGRGRLGVALLGSVATGVLHATALPVTLLK